MGWQGPKAGGGMSPRGGGEGRRLEASQSNEIFCKILITRNEIEDWLVLIVEERGTEWRIISTICPTFMHCWSHEHCQRPNPFRGEQEFPFPSLPKNDSLSFSFPNYYYCYSSTFLSVFLFKKHKSHRVLILYSQSEICGRSGCTSMTGYHPWA